METKVNQPVQKTQIPMLDISQEVDALRTELLEAIQGVLESGQFIMGPNVRAFEEEMAAYLGVKYAISLNSGTDALVLGLKACGIGPGDEVITPSFTFFATAEAICQVGATPVFVDIHPDTFTIDPEQVLQAQTPRTKAIIPVHLFGGSAEMGLIQQWAVENGIKIIEDVAQALGGEWQQQKAGTFGDVGCYSFFPSKNLGAYGDGGLLSTDDDHLAELVRKLRTHGSLVKYHNELIGYNSRLDELQAAILRVKLPYLDQSNRCRIEAARLYDVLLQEHSEIILPKCAPNSKHVYHQYTIRVKGGLRDDVKRALAGEGIQTMIYYPVPIHQLPVFRGLGIQLPVSELIATEVLSLPIWPGIEPVTQEIIAEVIGKFLRQRAGGG